MEEELPKTMGQGANSKNHALRSVKFSQIKQVAQNVPTMVFKNLPKKNFFCVA